MKKALLLFIAGCISLCGAAQQYPPEWVNYTSGRYLSNIQTDYNGGNKSETDFKNYLLNTARAELAKQISLHVRDVADIDKTAVNGMASVTYRSNTEFKTDVNIKLLETKTFYDPYTKEGAAIAYIEKGAARDYYRNEVNNFLSKAENALTMARNYIGSGFNGRAKTELEAILPGFRQTDDSFVWLAIFGLPQSESEQLLARRNESEQTVKKMLADLQHATSVYLVCSAEIFGAKYPALQNELKGKLAAQGCSFAASPDKADWVIRIEVSAREYNQTNTNGRVSYFAYADANITVDKILTSQRIYEDGVSVKGGHTLGYKEAARTACKNLAKQLGDIILQNIQ